MISEVVYRIKKALPVIDNWTDRTHVLRFNISIPSFSTVTFQESAILSEIAQINQQVAECCDGAFGYYVQTESMVTMFMGIIDIYLVFNTSNDAVLYRLQYPGEASEHKIKS